MAVFSLLLWLLKYVLIALPIIYFIVTLCFSAGVETILGIDYINWFKEVSELILPVRIMVFALVEFILVFGLTYYFFFISDKLILDSIFVAISMIIFLALPLAWLGLFNSQHILVTGEIPYTSNNLIIITIGMLVGLILSLTSVWAISREFYSDRLYALNKHCILVFIGFGLSFLIMEITVPGLRNEWTYAFKAVEVGALIIVATLMRNKTRN